ncbi:FAD-dependent oxidoreductase [Spiractinospora alimapuensis]|uniref:FAD-dependent oxidoreductase n=1 Tax=Spiractinospora alimapuensis TaxID=2820884 RepID=UPI002ED33CA7
MRQQRYAVVGGGILGTAVARRLLEERPAIRLSLLEKEDDVGTHQTGHNSGVVHAGLYYQPGSLKARLCRRGVGLLRAFCRVRGDGDPAAGRGGRPRRRGWPHRGLRPGDRVWRAAQ